MFPHCTCYPERVLIPAAAPSFYCRPIFLLPRPPLHSLPSPLLPCAKTLPLRKTGMAPGRGRKPLGTRNFIEVPLTEYERSRNEEIMKNNRELERLGIKTLVPIVNNTSVKRKGEDHEVSGSLYTGQESGQESEDCEDEAVISKVANAAHTKNPTRFENTFVRGTKASKRVVAPQDQDVPNRVTRQKTRDLALVSSLDPQQVINLGPPNATPTHDVLVSGSDPSLQQDLVDITDEGALAARKDPDRIRGRSVGRELDRLSRGLCMKLPIHVSKGNRRPEAPIQAAKLASEGGITLRQHIPILTHWKDYKKDKSHLQNYIGKIGAQFTIDTKNEAVQYACADLLKCGQRQMRHKLKKKYFNGVPASQVRTTSPVNHMTDDEWQALVQMWSDPKHKERCLKNQQSREKVQLLHCTGSRSYIAQAHVVKQEKYKDVQPTALDLFKDFHYSKNKGFSEPIKKAIADMEAIMAEPVQDKEQSKSVNHVVSQVVKSTTFLQVAGIQPNSNNSSKGGTSSKVQQLQAELEIEKKSKEDLRHEFEAMKKESEMAMETLKKESEMARAKQAEEIEKIKKGITRNNVLPSSNAWS